MSDLSSPPALPFLGSPSPAPPAPSTSLVPNLPNALAAFESKYREIGPTLETRIPAPAFRSLVRFDASRVLRGQAPLSRKATALAALAASRTDAVTPASDRNPLSILTNAVADLRQITSAIPRLPVALYHEATELPNLPAALSRALAADSPGEVIAQVAEAPGVRLLPGAYVASNVARGNATELATHPLMTFLDVLPAASSGAARTAVGRAAKEAGMRPLTALATRRLNPAATPLTAELIPNRLGAAAQAVTRTRPGQTLATAFGRDAREASRMVNLADARVAEQLNPDAPALAASTDTLTNLARESRALQTAFDDLDPSRRAELARIGESDPARIPDLPPRDREFVDRWRDLSDRFAHLGEEEGALARIVDERNPTDRGEIYTADQARRILMLRSQRDRTRTLIDLRDRITDPTANISAADLLADAPRAVLAEGTPTAMRANLAEGFGHALDAAGFDAQPIIEAARALRARNLPAEEVADVIRRTASAPQPRPVLPVAAITDRLIDLPATVNPARARHLRDLIISGDYRHAANLAADAPATALIQAIGLDPAAVIDSLRRASDRSGFLDRIKQFASPRRLSAATRAADRAFASTVPARFGPMVAKQTAARIESLYTSYPNFTEIARRISEGDYAAVPDPTSLRTIQREMATTWADLKANGADPIYMHRVSPAKAASIDFPHVLETISTPSQFRARTNDLTPHVADPAIGLSHQALELLSRRASEDLIASLVERFGKTADELRATYEPAARIRAQRHPSLTVSGHLDSLIAREFTQFDPRSIIPWRSARISGLDQSRTYLPKTVAKTIHAMHNPNESRLGAAFDPVMNTFRASVLALSPRFLLNNLVGGAVMLLADTGPDAFRYLRAARTALRDGTLPDDVRLTLGSSTRPHIEFHARGGTTLARLLDEARTRSPALAPGIDLADRARASVSTIVRKSYDLNGLVDDMYKSMAYLQHRDKALTRGLSRAESEAAGSAAIRRVFQTWDDLTPVERTVLRSVFPFYSWARFAIRFALRYPFDHPIRASIMAAFARNELDDLGTGLPQSFLGAFFLGHPDRDGKVTAFVPGSMNPFRDVANYFTLGGFLSSVNPALSTVFESVGMDPLSGTAELYPDLTYDPTTGNLRARSSNPLANFVYNTIPQAEVLASLTGASAEFRELARTNPAAANRRLLSGVGIPLAIRSYDIPGERIAAELNRSRVRDDAFRQGLRGDDREAQRHTGLPALLQQVRQLQTGGALGPYTPPADVGAAATALADQVEQLSR